MKAEGQKCPKCGGGRILHSPTIADRDRYFNKNLALQVKGILLDRPVGELEAYICAKCGYTELYVRDLDALLLEIDS